jgi:hypothetical protein
MSTLTTDNRLPAPARPADSAAEASLSRPHPGAALPHTDSAAEASL